MPDNNYYNKYIEEAFDYYKEKFDGPEIQSSAKPDELSNITE